MSAFLSGILKSVFKGSGAKGIKSIAPAVIRGVKATAPKTIRGVKAGAGALAKAKFLAQPLGKVAKVATPAVSRAGLFPPKAVSTAGKQIVKSAGSRANFLSQTLGKTIKPDLSKIGKDPLTKLAKQAGAGLLGGSALATTIALAKKKRRKNKK